MKNWSWRKIFGGLAGVLVILGLAPVADLYWSSAHNLQPLSMPLPLKRGEYSSPVFKTDLNDSYQIDIVWRGAMDEQMKLDLHWSVVEDNGAVIQQGILNNQLRGNTITLGEYRARRGRRQRIVLRNLQDAQGMDQAHPILEIGLPERGLDSAYEAAFAMRFSPIVAGAGLLILLSLLLWPAIRRA